MRTNRYLAAVAVVGFMAVAQGAQAGGVTMDEKAALDQATTQVGRDLEARLAQFEAESMDLGEMKAAIQSDLKAYGFESELSQVMDRFETRDQLIAAVETTIHHQAVAGRTFFANTRFLMNQPSHNGLQTFGKVVLGCFTVMADMLLIPTTVVTDISNFLFAGASKNNSLAYLERATAGSQEMTDCQNAKAAWVSLITVPTDILLTPFYTIATVYKTIEAQQRH